MGGRHHAERTTSSEPARNRATHACFISFRNHVWRPSAGMAATTPELAHRQMERTGFPSAREGDQNSVRNLRRPGPGNPTFRVKWLQFSSMFVPRARASPKDAAEVSAIIRDRGQRARWFVSTAIPFTRSAVGFTPTTFTCQMLAGPTQGHCHRKDRPRRAIEMCGDWPYARTRCANAHAEAPCAALPWQNRTVFSAVRHTKNCKDQHSHVLVAAALGACLAAGGRVTPDSDTASCTS